MEIIIDKPNGLESILPDILLRKPFTINLYLKRIPFEDLPSTEKEQEEFLREMFQEKVINNVHD